MNITNVAAWLGTIALFIVLVVVGKSFLIPVFLALFIWYLVNAINSVIRVLPPIRRTPNWLTLTLSFLFIGFGLYNVGDMIAVNINEFIDTAGEYSDKVDEQIAELYRIFRIKGEVPTIDSIDIMSRLSNNALSLLNGVTAAAKNFFLVLIYVIFLMIEQGAFPKKLKAIGLTGLASERLATVLKQINWAMRTYLGVKTFTSFLTALLSYIVFLALGLDYAFFWAFIIFLFNYVPTVGSIIATILPAMLAFLQFEGISAFLIIVIGVSAIQVAVGNILEPRLMGDSLNISPLVIVLSLILWSLMWGVVGMLLSVPITVAIIIICSQFPSTRNVAILLSKDGRLSGMTQGQLEDPIHQNSEELETSM